MNSRFFILPALWAALCVLPPKAFTAGEATTTNAPAMFQHYEKFASTNVAARNVDVWLPPGYATHPGQHYPVVYMHDGQNLFDARYSTFGMIWNVDGAMEKLIAEHQARAAIIVGIWNTRRRMQEYVPAKMLAPAKGSPKYAAAMKDLTTKEGVTRDEDMISDRYLKFLVEELKPFIDQNFRTEPDRANTFIMGSSAGALISLYAVCEYPRVFGGAGCVSTHWPIGDGLMIDYTAARLPDPATHKLYFDYGTETLDRDYEPYQKQMDAILSARGYQSGVNWLTRKFPGEEHSEKSWRKRVNIPLQFLLGQ